MPTYPFFHLWHLRRLQILFWYSWCPFDKEEPDKFWPRWNNKKASRALKGLLGWNLYSREGCWSAYWGNYFTCIISSRRVLSHGWEPVFGCFRWGGDVFPLNARSTSAENHKSLLEDTTGKITTVWSRILESFSGFLLNNVKNFIQNKCNLCIFL